MSVLDREALQASPLADLHAIASELSIDGYRRLRRAALIDAILGKQTGEAASEVTDDQEGPGAVQEEASDRDTGRRRRGRRGGRPRGETRDEPAPEETEVPERRAARPEARDAEPAARDAQPDAREAQPAGRPAQPEDQLVEGVVELLANGSGFVRVNPPEPSDDDVYISAAQVKRCELVSGDRIAGPRRAPRRSERFASLVRIDTINGQPADEVADSVRFDDLPASFPTERFRLGSEDPTVKAIEWLTPIGRGSRVAIVGGAGSGKTEALLRLAGSLVNQEELVLSLALAGVRPEEFSSWRQGPLSPAAAVGLGASPDAQGHTVELVVDQAKRVAARGANAVVLIDTLDGLHGLAARRALAAARNIIDGGSLTIIATATAPLGGETTVIALDRSLASAGRFPALDLVASGTIRPELLVGEPGAQAIARARAEAIDAS